MIFRVPGASKNVEKGLLKLLGPATSLQERLGRFQERLGRLLGASQQKQKTPKERPRPAQGLLGLRPGGMRRLSRRLPARI